MIVRMGKRRRSRRSETRHATGWVTGALLCALGLGAIGLSVAAFQSASPPAALAEYTPRPAPTQTTSPRAVFIGDSYTADSSGWVTPAATAMGWRPMNYAVGGTGYVATGSGAGAGTYTDAIAAHQSINPTYVIISGGRNDNGQVTAEAVTAAITQAQAQWPAAQIIVTSMLWDDDPAPSWFDQSWLTIRDASTAAGATFLDLGQPLAGRTDLLVADGIHPSPAGGQAIADAFVQAWTAAGLPISQ